MSAENAGRNVVASRLVLSAPEQLPPDTRVDIVIANILARPLIELAPRLRALVRPHGRLLLTGLLHEQADDVRAAYTDEFDFEARQRGEWILFIGRRKKER